MCPWRRVAGWVFARGLGGEAAADGLDNYREEVEGDEDPEVEGCGDGAVAGAVLLDHFVENVVACCAEETRCCCADQSWYNVSLVPFLWGVYSQMMRMEIWREK